MTTAQHTSSEWPAWATETIQIVASDPAWPRKAAEEIRQLEPLLFSFGSGPIEHIGSTSVPSLPAKPIIDLQTEIPSFDQIETIAATLRAAGDWHYVPPELDQRPYRRFFIKVADGHRSIHLHLLLKGAPQASAQRRFRDILIIDPNLREGYLAIKQAAANQFSHDRELYTEMKSSFINRALSASADQPSGAPPPSNRIRIVFATNNANKVREIRSAVGDSLDIVSLEDANIDIDIPEPHDTLEANATEKSSTIHHLTGGNCFSEDTGLEVYALNGEPGVKSARYAGEDRAFEKNIEKLLTKLGNNPDRRARFRTVISLILDEKEYLFEGVCEGHILTSPTGAEGFGYDPVFSPEGETRSFAEMGMEEKNRYSHRRKAADQLVSFLRQYAGAKKTQPAKKENP